MDDSINTSNPRLQVNRWVSKALMLWIFLLACGTAHCADVEDDNPITRAQALVDAGKANEALTLLRPFQPQLEGEPAFDYVFGLAALDSGYAVEAIFALERVVDTVPNHGPARAELARAYLALGEVDDAKAEFEKVKEIGDLPPEAKQTIDRYLTGIEL
ncbi:MAG: tetratricopeptide repeat protein, partial [Gammaproteobacteria bacterium]